MRSTLRLAPLAALILLLAACAASPPADDGADGGDGGDGGDATTVTISGSSFGDDITVASGTTVTFNNEDSLPHTVTEGTDGTAAEGAAFDEEVAAGASVDVTFDEARTYDITCRIHSSMSMTVTVED